MAYDKVFGSDITRTLNKLNNNLYDLLTVNPVKPLPINNTKYISCNFVPKTDKYFIPKRKLRPKVRTVRDIRNLFEKDVTINLSTDIEKQQNTLLRKIRGGSSKDEKTKSLARNMLLSEKPISRMAWQMVININPENNSHPSQYVLWNGKCIQVNGSRGGKSKFIYNYDLGERRASINQKFKIKRNNLNIKKDLLKNSLNIKFMPGPLSRKKQLDISYQKYNIGNVELARLPKPGLEILPEYGKPIETSVANFLHNLRDVNGIISDKWAKFAVSVLGTNDNGRAIQSDKDCHVTFDLSYKKNQRRLLMRHDVDKNINSRTDNQIFSNFYQENEELTKQEVQKMLDEMLISVEIKLMENEIYTGEDTVRGLDTGDINNSLDSQLKEKVRRKGQSELNRLDVTVIRLCDSEKKKVINVCRKSFCKLGCICDSILSPFRLKNHCGLIECMFECKCDFNKYNLPNCFDDDILPGLVSLDKEYNSKLSKEEQKFHQTVILSGEKSILLKSQRRNWKAPEKYADFYSNMCLKAKKDIKRILSVVEVKLNCTNIEPWCMIHNLYKCFCKGYFTEKLSNDISNDETQTIQSEQIEAKVCSLEKQETGLTCNSNESTNKSILRPKTHHAADIKAHTDNKPDDIANHGYQPCARVTAYKKRKYSDVFYFNTNKKIMELEQNDQGLHKRMMEILKIDDISDIKKPKNDLDNPSISTTNLPSSLVPAQTTEKNKLLNEPKNEIENKLSDSSASNKLGDVITTQFKSTENSLNNKLKAWLEPSLKLYRQRFRKGFFKKSLEPPRAGKIALYPWDFIINRYHEKKNLFLVTNQKPFRIFMAVDSRNVLFKKCIDISSIADLDKYPISVKNIITNEVDHLTDQLCILRGLSFCWELVGSVKKVCDRKTSDTKTNDNESSFDIEARSPENLSLCRNSPSPILVVQMNDATPLASPEKNIEQSKWFVMTIENDFSEIQFYNRGFFVKYDSIIKAINVARVSEKTVRLSSQKCNEGSSDPQFGIYAIPNANEYCVFIGPYEKNESLGIETVKTTLCNRKKKTRGVWITTNKVDNLRVIDNPLSFMSQVNLELGQVLDNSPQDETNIQNVSDTSTKSVVKAKEIGKIVKLVKPITITKTNNFYHLTPSGFLKPISGSPEKQISKAPIIIKKRLSHDFDATATGTSILCKTLLPQLNENQHSTAEDNEKASSSRPNPEIAPKIKDTEECRESNNMQQKVPARQLAGGMFILKPEEINRKSLLNKINFTPSPIENSTPKVNNNEIDMDIENFIANSIECSAPTTDDVFVISDEEDYCSTETLNKTPWKDVWIICKNIKKIGWIPGRQDVCGNLSFEFPGFKYTDFYEKSEAFAKITQVLARKVNIPDHLNLRWSVVDKRKELQKIKKLKEKDLRPDYVLTKWGLKHESDVAEHSDKNIKTYSRNIPTKRHATKFVHNLIEDNMELNVTENCIIHMDTESDVLLEEGEQLLTETVLKRDELSDSFSKISNERRQKISDRLRSIISSSSLGCNEQNNI